MTQALTPEPQDATSGLSRSRPAFAKARCSASTGSMPCGAAQPPASQTKPPEGSTAGLAGCLGFWVQQRGEGQGSAPGDVPRREARPRLGLRTAEPVNGRAPWCDGPGGGGHGPQHRGVLPAGAAGVRALLGDALEVGQHLLLAADQLWAKARLEAALGSQAVARVSEARRGKVGGAGQPRQEQAATSGEAAPGAGMESLPVSKGRPARFHATRPPSSTETPSWPKARSVHHSRGEEKMPKSVLSYTTTWEALVMPRWFMLSSKRSASGSMCGRCEGSAMRSMSKKRAAGSRWAQYSSHALRFH
jgi:hypothetical protein